MARKHQPLIVGGFEVEVTGRGFRIIERGENREREPWWYPAKRAIKLGFLPKVVRLYGDLDSLADVQAMFDKCNDLWAEMLEWLEAGEVDNRPIYDGTIGALVDCYFKDPKSPYHDNRFNTQRGYASWGAALKRVAGRRRISALVGNDLREWHRNVRKPASPGKPPRERLAKAIIQMTRIVLSYGKGAGLPECAKLLVMIDGMEFRKENDEKRIGKVKPKQKVVMNYAQAEAIVRAGLARGTRRGRSVALATAAQFEFTISQIDAIGYWIPVQHIAIEEGMIVRGGKLWRPGLRFDDFETGLLDLSRFKTGRKAVFDVNEYPLFQLALSAVPEDERAGPLVTDTDGDPVRYRVFYGMYRDVAEEAGVPAEVWSSRARHGGGTEARAAGAPIDDIADHLQKSDVEGTRRDYVAGNVETTRRVARRRVASRPKAAGTG
ncbi:hypothetical protein H8A97_30390 [Bradyrhizobium sp. Arg62]|uniref:hypothetical protein n=1 Tax=Bradyrhizobium brasilense TaxID=1419277 RepID=UPI001E61F390|nr:hypothetical protein [Bradyrhizobium brasilense]MCC8949295.1 hypothetical protein [Bradyrhizobium brasilense]